MIIQYTMFHLGPPKNNPRVIYLLCLKALNSKSKHCKKDELFSVLNILRISIKLSDTTPAFKKHK